MNSQQKILTISVITIFLLTFIVQQHQTTAQQQQTPETVDLIFVIDYHPLLNGTTYNDYSALEEFLNLLRTFNISETKTRIAFGAVVDDQQTLVKLTLSNGVTQQAINDSINDQRKYWVKNHTFKYVDKSQRKKMATKIIQEISTAESADRQYVPNIIVYIGLAPTPVLTDWHSAAEEALNGVMENPDIDVVLIFETYKQATGVDILLKTQKDHQATRITTLTSMAVAFDDMKSRIVKLLNGCATKKTIEQQCYYDDQKKCVQAIIYRPDPPDQDYKKYCLNGEETSTCAQSNGTCEINCANEMKTDVQPCNASCGGQGFKTMGGNQTLRHYKNCPPQFVKCAGPPCTTPQPVPNQANKNEQKPMEAWLIATIAACCGGGVLLVALLITLTVCLTTRKRRRAERGRGRARPSNYRGRNSSQMPSSSGYSRPPLASSRRRGRDDDRRRPMETDRGYSGYGAPPPTTYSQQQHETPSQVPQHSRQASYSRQAGPTGQSGQAGPPPPSGQSGRQNSRISRGGGGRTAPAPRQPSQDYRSSPSQKIHDQQSQPPPPPTSNYRSASPKIGTPPPLPYRSLAQGGQSGRASPWNAKGGNIAKSGIHYANLDL